MELKTICKYIHLSTTGLISFSEDYIDLFYLYSTINTMTLEIGRLKWKYAYIKKIVNLEWNYIFFTNKV